MKQQELINKLNELRSLPAETEVFEFKEAKNGYDFNKLGKYFSALSNEANLKNKNFAWLIFGIKDKGHKITGSSFRSKRTDLDSIKGEIANKTTNRITFIEIYELFLPEGRVVMFQIPSSPKGFPIAFEGHYYGRDGEELSPLNLEEIERIRNQSNIKDWSAGIVPDASLDDLDQKAIFQARQNFKNKYPELSSDMDSWDNLTFLNKAKITIKGKITRTTIILLGLPESEHFISPAEAKIRWILKDKSGKEKDYKIFSCPFLLAVDEVYAKIRNLTYRYLKEGTLFPEEVLQYEPYNIREALHNCIAHQDYTQGARINVVEMEDELLFTNQGSFIPGSIENVIKDNAPEMQYRNKFLANAMFNIKMVDTIGSGIRRMFDYQRMRFFPMPDYDLSNGQVKLSITGKVLDLEYARVLARHKDLTLDEIIMLDKLQKKRSLSETEFKYLKTKGLVEGRKPNLHISSNVAEKTNLKAEYIKTRGLKDDYFKDLILEYIDKYKQASKEEIDNLLIDILPGILNEKQRKNKIHNLIFAMSKKDVTIVNKGTNRYSIWVRIAKV